MDVERPVTVGEQEAAVIQEGEVSGHEAVLAPDLLRVLVLVLGIHAGLHGRILLPDGLSLKVHLGEGLLHLIRTDIEELLVPFLADLDAMSAALELLAKG